MTDSLMLVYKPHGDNLIRQGEARSRMVEGLREFKQKPAREPRMPSLRRFRVHYNVDGAATTHEV